MAKGSGSRLGVWIIVGLLFVGLIGFGGAGLVAGARTVATVGDKEITTQAYANALSSELDAFSQQLGIPVSFAQVEPMGLPQAVFVQVVSERVLDNETAELGISAGDAQVAQQLINDPRYQDLQGRFDRDAYSAYLDRLSMSERENEAGLREDVARALLQGAVVRGITAPDAYTDTLVAFAGERRSITFATLTEADLTEPVPAPDDAALEAYFDVNAENYMSPEIRRITYAWVTPEMLSGAIEIDEEEARGVYEERIADYVQEERRLVERLVYPDEEAAAAALARVDAGEADFEALVADRGLELADTDMGDVSEAQLGAAGEAVFAADPGAVVGPFQSPLGPALFRMNAVLQAQETTFEEAREEIGTELATARARRVIADGGEQMADLLIGGATLEDLSERTDLVLETMAWSEGLTEGPAAYDEFRAAIAAAEAGDYPELTDLEDGGVFALRLDAVEAPAQQTLDDVRDVVRADLQAEQTADAIAALAIELTGALAQGSDFADLDLMPEEHPGLLRRDFVAGTPPGFIDMVFTMAEGDIATMPTEAGTVILRLDAVAPVDAGDETIAAERADIVARASNGMAQDIYSAYTRALQDGVAIDIDTGAMEGVHALFR